MKKHIIDVKPIKNKNDLELFLIELSNTKNGTRDNLIAKIGLATGLRISDILGLKRKDVIGKTQTDIVEKKTGKKRTIYFKNFMTELINYLELTKDSKSEFLFEAPRDSDKHLAEHQYYKIMTKVADFINLESIGTHSLRKTFGYNYYKQTKDIASLQYIFNHSSQSITLRYLDITEDEIKASMENFKPF